MEMLDVIRLRRAVRDYKSEPVPAGLVNKLISAASWAPSAMNEQPWHFTVVTDRDLMGQISAKSKSAMLKNVDAMPRPGHFLDLLRDPSFNIFYNAPALIAISAPATLPWCTEDCAMAAQNLMLAAVTLGLGSCWIGFAQTWLNSEDGLKALELPRTQRVVAPIIIGFPKIAPPPVTRKKPGLNWIGDGWASLEEAEPPASPGIYGTLVHP